MTTGEIDIFVKKFCKKIVTVHIRISQSYPGTEMYVAQVM